MRGKYSAEKLLIEMLELDPVEFIGICKIMGVDIYEFDEKNEEGNEEENVECAGVVVRRKMGLPRVILRIFGATYVIRLMDIIVCGVVTWDS